MKKVNMQLFQEKPSRYELRKGYQEVDAPKCPYGNTYQWIGLDLETNEYVRFTKSVFKLLIKKIENE